MPFRKGEIGELNIFLNAFILAYGVTFLFNFSGFFTPQENTSQIQDANPPNSTRRGSQVF